MNNNTLNGSEVFDAGLVKCTCTTDAHRTPHLFHTQIFWEFICVDSGFALLGGDGGSSLLSAGDIAVIAPGEMHSLVCPKDTQMYCCLFLEKELGDMHDAIFALPGFIDLAARARSAPDTNIKRVKFECIRLDFSERQEFSRLCDRIIRERTDKCRGWQQIVRSLLCQAMVFYSRLDISAKRDKKEEEKAEGGAYQLLEYLEENYNRTITGAELSHISGLSADYTLKHFKAELSISPTEYLRRYRVAKSMELLRSTKLSVNEIAEQSGFGDMSAFSRVFKLYEGDTPSAYRKRYRIYED